MRTARTMCCRLIQDTDLSEHLRTALATRANDFPRQADVYGRCWKGIICGGDAHYILFRMKCHWLLAECNRL
jgi:hypothetical protein